MRFSVSYIHGNPVIAYDPEKTGIAESEHAINKTGFSVTDIAEWK